MTKSLYQYWWLLLTLIIITILFFVIYPDIKPLVWKTGETSAILGTVFAKLLIIGALLDQFIELFFPEEDDVSTKRRNHIEILKTIKENKRALKSELLNKELYGTKEDQIEVLENINRHIQNTNDKENEIKSKILSDDSKRSAYVRKVAFAIGLILALAGITILSEFIDMTPKNLNHKILSYLDIIFTAAVLSGGTSGINQLLKLLKDSSTRR